MDADWSLNQANRFQMGHATSNQTSPASHSPAAPLSPVGHRERAPSLSSIAPGGGSSMKRSSIGLSVSVHNSINNNSSFMDTGHTNTIASPSTCSVSFHPLFSPVSGPSSFLIPSPLSSSVCLFDTNSNGALNAADAAPAAGGGSGPSSYDRNGSGTSISSVESSPTTSLPYASASNAFLSSNTNQAGSGAPKSASSPTSSFDAFMRPPVTSSPSAQFASEAERVPKHQQESSSPTGLPLLSNNDFHVTPNPVPSHRQMPTPASMALSSPPLEFHDGHVYPSINPISLPTPPVSSFSPTHQSASGFDLHNNLAPRQYRPLHQMYEHELNEDDDAVRSLAASMDVFNLSESGTIPGRPSTMGSFDCRSSNAMSAATDWGVSSSPHSSTVDSSYFATKSDEMQYLRHTTRRPAGFQDNPALGPATGMGPPTMVPYDYRHYGQNAGASTSPGPHYPHGTAADYDQMAETRVPCRYFMEGYCSRGDTCHYSHNIPNGMTRSSAGPASPASNNIPTSINAAVNGNEMTSPGYMNDGGYPDRYKGGYSASSGFPTPSVNRSSEYPMIPRSMSSNLESNQPLYFSNNGARSVQQRAPAPGFHQQPLRSASHGSISLGGSTPANSTRFGPGSDPRGFPSPADYIMYGSPTSPISGGGYNHADFAPNNGMMHGMHGAPYGAHNGMIGTPDMYNTNLGGYIPYPNEMQPMNPYHHNQCGTKIQRGYNQHGHGNNNAVANNMGGNNINKLDMEARFAGLDLESVKGQYPALAKDQHGCRFLQRKLEEGGCIAATAILDEVVTRFAELMTDPFGNYLCQKLLEHVSDPQKTSILEQVTPHLAFVSLNMHGTRAVQKLVEHVSTSEQAGLLVKALGRHTITLIKDLNGNHVIQKCLVRLPPSDAQFVYDAVTQGCVEVSTHRHGCCVIQRCLDYATTDQRRRLAAEITGHCLMLVKDPFGNYVVQYVLDMGDTTFVDAIAARLRGHVVMLSMQKFASNVMEKCIRVSSPDLRRSLIAELFASKDVLDSLLRDGYANYVVQSCIDFIDMHQRTLLIERLAPLIPIIHNTPYGKRIMTKLNVVH